MALWGERSVVIPLLTFEVNMIGYYAVPDLPSNTRVHWLDADEKLLALERMDRSGKQLEEPVTILGLRRVLKKWHFWVYTAYYTLV